MDPPNIQKKTIMKFELNFVVRPRFELGTHGCSITLLYQAELPHQVVINILRESSKINRKIKKSETYIFQYPKSK